MSDVGSVYDSKSLKYDSLYQERLIHKVEDQVVSILLRSEINDSTKVLDIGSGTGSVIDYGRIPASNYLGVDVSQGMTDQARKKYPNHRFEVCDATKLSLDEKFNFITFIYGQVNYMGVDAMADIIKTHGTNDVKFLAICYAIEGNLPGALDYSYTAQYQTRFTPKDIFDALLEKRIAAQINGLSREESSHTVLAQLVETLSRREERLENSGFKYYIVSNIEMLKKDW